MVTVKRETLDYLDSISETFEDRMPRGDLIDALVEHVSGNEDLENAIFGPADDETDGPSFDGKPPTVLSELRERTADEGED